MNRAVVLAVCLWALPALAGAGPTPIVQKLDGAGAVAAHLKSLGYQARGGVAQAAAFQDEGNPASFPHFSSSFTVNGAAYPFTMVGHKPASGTPCAIRSLIVPLRMNFSGFGADGSVSVTFEPRHAVANMANSPLYVPAAFPNGFGQFGDQMQRAAFWNHMDAGHNWHLYMAPPAVFPALDIEVTPETGTLYDLGGGAYMGDVLIDFMDSQIQTILEFMDLPGDVLPIFVTDGVTAEALGYHNAYVARPIGDGKRLQTMIFTSWLDPALVPPLFADVSTFNHELLEWMNDPFVNNVVPEWMYPPSSDPASVSCVKDLL